MKNNRVRIIEDGRKNKNAKGMLGIYEGDFPYMLEEFFAEKKNIPLGIAHILGPFNCHVCITVY